MHNTTKAHTSHWLERRLGQWRAISTAAGFRPSFPDWWSQKTKHVVGLPDRWPVAPPDGDLARMLVQDFQTDLHHLEQMLMRSRVARSKQERRDNPARIFRDLQAPRPEPVQMLLAQASATIEEIDEEECAVVLDSANAFELGQTIEHNGTPLIITHQDTDKLWLATMPPVQVGDSLTQASPITAVTGGTDMLPHRIRIGNRSLALPSLHSPIHQRCSTHLSLMRCGRKPSNAKSRMPPSALTAFRCRATMLSRSSPC